MNISIYYNTKKVTIRDKNQIAHNQSFKNIDELTRHDIFREFELFINHSPEQELVFGTTNVEEGLSRFSQAFKYIYAAGGLVYKDERYLFIYRLGTWDLPKGKLEKNEDPRDAAIRECEEECGLTQLSITRELKPTYHMYEHQKWGYALKKTFWYKMSTGHTGELVPQTEEMIEKVEWMSKAEISGKVFENTYFAILDVIADGV